MPFKQGWVGNGIIGLASEMRELVITVPEFDNNGRSLADLHRTVSVRICYAFGGFTTSPGNGACRRATSGEFVIEHVIRYIIAAPNERCNTPLRLLAQWIAVAAEQDSVYIRLFDGTIEYVTAPLTKEEYRDLREGLVYGEEYKKRMH